MISNWFRSRSIILLYHRVAKLECDPWSLAVTPAHFAEHLEVLRRHRRVRLDQLQPGRWWNRGGLSVAITFDDGYADNLFEAASLLRRYETPATFFIATGYVGEQREFWWDELTRIVYESKCPPGCNAADEDDRASRDRIHESYYHRLQPMSHQARRGVLDELSKSCGVDLSGGRPSHRSMTPDELKRLAAHDLFEIGAHTVTHPNLATQPVAVQDAELKNSKRWLEEFLNRRIPTFSYPYGGKNTHYTEETVARVRDAGFLRACTTCSRAVGSADALEELPRINIPDMGGDEFEKLLLSH